MYVGNGGKPRHRDRSLAGGSSRGACKLEEDGTTICRHVSFNSSAICSTSGRRKEAEIKRTRNDCRASETLAEHGRSVDKEFGSEMDKGNDVGAEGEVVQSSQTQSRASASVWERTRRCRYEGEGKGRVWVRERTRGN
jgi:hypothetical protein